MQEPPVPAAQPPARRRAGMWLWLGAILLAGLLLRLPFISSDISEFPQDRNSTTAVWMRSLEREVQWQRPASLKLLFASLSFQPEFQFTANAGWLAGRLGLPPIAGARGFNVFVNLLGALGIFWLGRHAAGRTAGLAACACYLLLPLSVLLGRGLLPENLANTLLIWACVLALRTTRRPAVPQAAWFVLLAALGVLAKLPAALFWPFLAFVFWWERRRDGARPVALLLLAAFSTYLLTVLHYRFDFLNPIPDLVRLRHEFRHLAATPAEALSWRAAGVLLNRSVLALTLPGLALALGGCALLLRAPGRHYWLLALLAMALVSGLMNVKSNTYWIYPLVIPGAVLAGMALAGLAAQPWSIRLFALAVGLIALVFCPGVRTVHEYFIADPRYRLAATLRDQLRHPVLYRSPGDLIDLGVYTGLPGEKFDAGRARDFTRALARGQFLSYLTANTGFDEFDLSVLQRHPLVAQIGRQAALFNAHPAATIGQPVPEPLVYGVEAPLGPSLSIRKIEIDPPFIAPSQSFTVAITWGRGPGYAEEGPPFLFAELRQLGTGWFQPLQPLARAALIGHSADPLLQPPGFPLGDYERVEYHFRPAGQLPAGPYLFNVALVDNLREQMPLARTEFPPRLIVKPPQRLERPPVAGTLNWSQESYRRGVMFFGRLDWRPQVRQGTQLIVTAPVAPGRYRVEISGRATPAGAAEAERWPVLHVKQAYNQRRLHALRFDSRYELTGSLEIDWAGPEDSLLIVLPEAGYDTNLVRFPLYLEQVSSGDRAFTPTGVWFLPI